MNSFMKKSCRIGGAGLAVGASPPWREWRVGADRIRQPVHVNARVKSRSAPVTTTTLGTTTTTVATTTTTAAPVTTTTLLRRRLESPRTSRSTSTPRRSRRDGRGQRRLLADQHILGWSDGLVAHVRQGPADRQVASARCRTRHRRNCCHPGNVNTSSSRFLHHDRLGCHRANVVQHEDGWWTVCCQQRGTHP